MFFLLEKALYNFFRMLITMTKKNNNGFLYFTGKKVPWIFQDCQSIFPGPYQTRQRLNILVRRTAIAYCIYRV